MLKIYCDRCEKDFSEEYNAAMQSQSPQLFKITQLGPNGQTIEGDLCLECSKELKKWFLNKEESKKEDKVENALEV